LIRKALLLVAVAAAIAAASGTLVVALAFALYALVREYAGPAWAGAAVAGAAALLMIILALVVALQAKLHKREPSLGERAAAFVKEKPVTAAAAALAAGVVAVRNPKALLGMLMVFLEPKSRRKS
jgi:hypothetical protein